nr:unnamed protein product [Digitaria exilis]
MAKVHVLMVPFPAQGHVTPLMELSHRLVDHGFEVIFVNTETHHARVLSALPASGTAVLGGIHLASIPDGLASDDERRDLSKLVDSCYRHMPEHLERLVADMEAAGRPKVKWLVGDLNLGVCFEVAKKLGVRVASFWPSSAACLAILLSVPKLVEKGLVNEQALPWDAAAPGVADAMDGQQWRATRTPALFQAVTRFDKFKNLAEVIICNSFQDIEAGALKLFSDILPIGPLFADRELQKPVGHFLPEDECCIRWLDAQPDRSVVYVAFGSMVVFDPCQFVELAEGLELTGRPFLWVVRPDFTAGLSMAWFDEFRKRVADTGLILSWCSQQQVLAHRTAACFVSHCGWNSTMEGLRNGVPFMCWPHLFDQFLDGSYITNVWRTGVAVSPNADGIVAKEELRSKVDQVVGDAEIKERAWLLKEAACGYVSEGGSSYKNFQKLVNQLGE